MCIIVYKPKRTKLPKDEYLVNCFRSNSDGAGFMYLHPTKNKVVIRKGFMDYASFKNAIDSVKSLYNVPLVMHFRIGTQGLNDKRMTHPFPVTNDKKALISTQGFCELGVAHNGIIPLTSYHGQKEEFSDTYYFIKNYMSLIVGKDVRYHEDADTIELLSRLADSKLCILGTDGHVELVGNFIKETDGCYYSNGSYKSSYIGLYSYYNDEYWDKWYDEFDNETTKRTRISAMFVPQDMYVLDENCGSMESAKFDSYLYDKNGLVYIYDFDNDFCMLLDGYSVVDNEFDYQYADDKMCIMYELVEENTK